jgi:hypothetical protein
MRIVITAAIIALCSFLVGIFVARPAWIMPAAALQAAPADKEPVANATLDLVRAELKKLEGFTPDQAAVMTHVGYHWSNLWFAIEQENWPLADFYLSETRNNIRWAVRVKPVREVNKEKVDLAKIADALDGTQFAQMKAAIDGKDRARCVKLYDEALQGCYACHKASLKPYLRPRRPEAPEVRVINFDPTATKPE